MKVLVNLTVWLNIDADTGEEARIRVARIAHEAELDIERLLAVGEILEVEPDETEV